MATDKQSGNPLDPYNRSGGIDAKFVLFQNLNLRGYYAKSWTRGLDGDNASFGGRLTYANNWFNIYAGHGVSEKNFNPEMGFVTFADDKPTIFQANWTPRPHALNIRQLQLGVFAFHHPNNEDQLIAKEWSPSLTVLFNNGAEIDSIPRDSFYNLLLQPLHLYKNISIPVGGYSYIQHSVTYTSSGNHRITYTGNLVWGDYYTGTVKSATATAQYRPNAHLALALNNTLNVFRLPQGNFSIELAGLQVSYAFNRFLNLTTFLQEDTSQLQAASANIRLRYTFRPDSDLYVIYNNGTRFESLVAGNPALLRDQRFAIKTTYSWSR